MTKALLRKDFLARRLAMPSEEMGLKNSLITQKLIEVLSNKSFTTIHIFLPQTNKNEIDTRKIVSSIRVSFPDVSIAIPYVIPGTRLMQHYQLTPQTSLRENQWGIPEPDPLQASTVLPHSIDVVIVPLLAFDKLGYRVGYGGGFYDRFLSQCRHDAVKIGLSFFDPVERIVDVDAYDIALDYCVTPEGVWAW